MKLSWPYIRSFFTEEVLETTSSPYNKRLEVWYAYGRHIVNSKNVNLSFGSLDTVFRSAFKKINLTQRPWTSVLLLGLGAGNVPAILKETGQDWYITGVEIDAEMVRLGQKWCGLADHPHLHIVIDDAIHYVQNCDRQFDLIIIDLFVDELVPSGAEQEAFIRRLPTLLNPHGAILYNRLMHTPRLRELSIDFTRKMQEILPGTTFFKAHKNRMLMYEK